MGNRLFWFLILALSAIRLAVLVGSNTALFYDEAYYHYWSLQPAWGYYSKPPMVAWLIQLITGGATDVQAEWLVRLPASLCYAAATFWVYRLAFEMFDQPVARLAALIFYSMPLISFNSLFITTDAPLTLFWSFCLWSFWRAYHHNSWQAWLLTGTAAGLGLLSKYTMGILAPSFLLFLLLERRMEILVSVKFVLALTLASAIFCGNLLWNAEHDFISFVHTSEISKLSESLFHPEALLTFLAGQFILFSPVALWLIFRSWRANTPQLRYLLCTGFGILSLISLQALLSRAHVNWAAPAYVSLSVVCGYHLSKAKPNSLFSIAAFNLAFLSIFYGYNQLQSVLDIEASRANNPYQRLTGWRELIRAIPEQHYDTDTLWVSGSRRLLSYLHYYLPSQREELHQRILSIRPTGDIKSQFDLVGDLNANPQNNRDLVLLTEDSHDLSPLCFEHSQLLTELHENVYPSLTRPLWVYQVRGYIGNENCQKLAQ